MKRLSIIALLLIFALGGQAQTTDAKKLVGYVDLGKYFDIDPKAVKTEVEISNPLLSLVAKASEGEDEKLSQLLNQLQLIKVYTLATDEKRLESIQEKIERLDTKLKSEKWDRFLRVREGEELTNGYLRLDGGKISGFTLLSVDGRETVLINIVGNLDLESLNRLSKTFDLPKLDSLEQKP
ncbi:DUF4252 domain-containing protein [candidate division KSB1 bacterium]|nr:DUF4252 domain-containing protein [candidate division KSB1 bacterium]